MTIHFRRHISIEHGVFATFPECSVVNIGNVFALVPRVKRLWEVALFRFVAQVSDSQ